MKTTLDHLPEPKREQIEAITALLSAEASVEMVVLFGSHARGDWVEDVENRYFSDFDLLVVVATAEQARDLSLWSELSRRARLLAGRTPVSIIVHDLKEINGEIRLCQYFFVDILREGILLHTSRRYQLATPKALELSDRLALGLINFRYWFPSASGFWRLSGQSAGQGLLAHAAFLLHQAVERYFHAVLLVYTGYKPKTHNIEDLAEQTAPLHPALEGALPRAEGEEKRLFQLLKKAYIEARYSKGYKITTEELSILRGRVLDLAVRVREACAEKLASFCGPDAVGALPDAPPAMATGALPEPPPFDDTAAFESWRESLTTLSFERGQASGIEQGIERGIEQGIERGQRQMFLRLLEQRFGPLPAEAVARVTRAAPGDIERWSGRLLTAATLAEALEEAPPPAR